MPERSVRSVSALAQAGDEGWEEDLPRPSRMLARPEPIDVVALLPDDAPRLFIWRGKRFAVTPLVNRASSDACKASVTKKCHRASMNVMSPVFSTHFQLSHTDEASFWRGRYVEEFAMAEVAVSETLATLSTLASSGAKSLLPTAVGQRFEALQAVVGAGGPLASVGGRVAKALDELREHKRCRNFLCHGSSEVSVDNLGEWHLTLSFTSFRAGAIKRSSMQITAGEAAILLEKLRSARIYLDGQLRGMFASFIG